MFSEFPKTLKIAIPIIISNLSYVGLGLIDSAMIGVVDYRQLAASSLVINVVSLPQVLGMGMGMALSPLTAFANGQNDEKKIAKLLFNGVMLSAIVAVIISLLLFFNSDLLFHMGQDKVVAAYSISFFKLISLSLIPMLIFTAIKQFCDGLEYTKTAMVLSIISLPINAFLNWIFIYGNLGFPRMELTGAGYGTLITRILITVLLIIVVLKHRLFSKYINYRKEAWKIDLSIWKEIAGMGIPTSLQYGMEVAAFAISGVMIGWLGATLQAAHQIALQLATVTFMAASGLSLAGSIRVANAYGLKQGRLLRNIGTSTLYSGLIYGCVCGLLFILCKSILPAFFTSNPAVISSAAVLLIFAAIFQISDATQAIGVGLLRGIKDVKVPTILVTLAYWGIGIPVGYYLAFKCNMGAVGIWLGFVAGLSASSISLNIRFLKKTRIEK